MNVFVVILALAYLFISFTNSKLDDKTYKNEFINKYAVFSIIKPKNVDFAGEKVDVNSNNLWERFDKELLKKSRYSIPFFMHPVSEMKLNVLDSCISNELPKAYNDITAGEFLNERLIELGLLKK